MQKSQEGALAALPAIKSVTVLVCTKPLNKGYFAQYSVAFMATYRVFIGIAQKNLLTSLNFPCLSKKAEDVSV